MHAMHGEETNNRETRTGTIGPNNKHNALALEFKALYNVGGSAKNAMHYLCRAILPRGEKTVILSFLLTTW